MFCEKKVFLKISQNPQENTCVKHGRENASVDKIFALFFSHKIVNEIPYRMEI